MSQERHCPLHARGRPLRRRASRSALTAGLATQSPASLGGGAPKELHPAACRPCAWRLAYARPRAEGGGGAFQSAKPPAARSAASRARLDTLRHAVGVRQGTHPLPADLWPNAAPDERAFRGDALADAGRAGFDRLDAKIEETGENLTRRMKDPVALILMGYPDSQRRSSEEDPCPRARQADVPLTDAQPIRLRIQVGLQSQRYPKASLGQSKAQPCNRSPGMTHASMPPRFVAHALSPSLRIDVGRARSRHVPLRKGEPNRFA